MFKLYSKGCENALRVLTEIPFNQRKEKFLAKELCRKADVAETPTRKSLQRLVKRGILESMPGPGGGYRLSTDPDKVSLLSLIYAIDGDDFFERCVMGFPQCSNEDPCPIHNFWAKMKKEMLKEMDKKTLSELMKSKKGKNYESQT